MTDNRIRMLLGAAILVGCGATATQSAESQQVAASSVPQYRIDPSWPRPLPERWTIGPVCGVAVDSHENVWIVQRQVVAPGSGGSAVPAPQVLEFAPDGTLLASWGGPGPGYDWPQEEHGIYVDAHDNVWLGGAGGRDNQLLKFTRQGKFLLQIGHPGQSRGSNDTQNLGAPANMVVDEAANELYVADGYVNHRIIVFDATTGAYKRHWGAYGKRPDDDYYARQGIRPGEHPTNASKEVPGASASPQFSLVHGVRLSRDGLVYVSDRSNNRIQVFRRNGRFVREAFIANDEVGSGSTSDIGLSSDPQQRFAFVADSTKQHVYVVERSSLRIVASFGEPGTLPGQFGVAHNLAVDSKGNVFVSESRGARVQKFVQTR